MSHPSSDDHLLTEVCVSNLIKALIYRYVSIVKEEELDISQPALDPRKSEIHHQITVRRGDSRVHRFTDCSFSVQQTLETKY